MALTELVVSLAYESEGDIASPPQARSHPHPHIRLQWEVYIVHLGHNAGSAPKRLAEAGSTDSEMDQGTYMIHRV
jgi:hypothetical protein